MLFLAVLIIGLMWLIYVISDTPNVVGGHAERKWYCLLDQHTGHPNVTAFEFNNLESNLSKHAKLVVKGRDSRKPVNVPSKKGQEFCTVIHARDPPAYCDSDDNLEIEYQEWKLDGSEILLLRYWPMGKICYTKMCIRFTSLDLSNKLRLMCQTFGGLTPLEPVLADEWKQIYDFAHIGERMPKPHTFTAREFAELTTAGKKWTACVKYNGISCHLAIRNGASYLVHADSSVITKLPGTSTVVDTLLYGELMGPNLFIILDVLILNGESQTAKPYTERMAKSLNIDTPGGLTVVARKAWGPITNLEQTFKDVDTYVKSEGIDSDGIVFVSDDPLGTMASLKWKDHSMLSVDALIDLKTMDIWSRDRSDCVQLRGVKPTGLDGFKPPASGVVIAEMLPSQNWKVLRLRNDKDVPNAVRGVREILKLAKQRVDARKTMHDLRSEAWRQSVLAASGEKTGELTQKPSGAKHVKNVSPLDGFVSLGILQKNDIKSFYLKV